MLAVGTRMPNSDGAPEHQSPMPHSEIHQRESLFDEAINALLDEAINADVFNAKIQAVEEVFNAKIQAVEEESVQGENEEAEETVSEVGLNDLQEMKHQISSRRKRMSKLVISRKNKKMKTELRQKMHGDSDVLCVDLMAFQLMIGIVVLLDAILQGIEVDHDLGTAGFVLNSILTAVYVFEAGLKMYSYGLRKYFCIGDSLKELFLTILCVLDIWVLPTLAGNEAGLNALVTVVRAIRVLRIVRSLQLFQELWLLLNGLLKACMALMWVFILILIITYAFAIVMTYVVGRDCDDDGNFGQFEACAEAYGNLPRSMLSLFMLMTMDMDTLQPLARGNIGVFFLLIVFMMLTSFGLLNIIMGVMVEQVLLASAANEEQIKHEKEHSQQTELQLLQVIFQEADSDSSGHVTVEEFQRICERVDVRAIFEDLGMPVSRSNLAQRLFEVLDVHDRGEMDIDSFLDRTRTLTKEGKQLKHDQTLLLMDVRHLNRRLMRAEKGLNEKMCSMDEKIEQVIQVLNQLTVQTPI